MTKSKKLKCGNGKQIVTYSDFVKSQIGKIEADKLSGASTESKLEFSKALEIFNGVLNTFNQIDLANSKSKVNPQSIDLNTEHLFEYFQKPKVDEFTLQDYAPNINVETPRAKIERHKDNFINAIRTDLSKAQNIKNDTIIFTQIDKASANGDITRVTAIKYKKVPNNGHFDLEEVGVFEQTYATETPIRASETDKHGLDNDWVNTNYTQTFVESQSQTNNPLFDFLHTNANAQSADTTILSANKDGEFLASKLDGISFNTVQYLNTADYVNTSQAQTQQQTQQNTQQQTQQTAKPKKQQQTPTKGLHNIKAAIDLANNNQPITEKEIPKIEVKFNSVEGITISPEMSANTPLFNYEGLNNAEAFGENGLFNQIIEKIILNTPMTAVARTNALEGLRIAGFSPERNLLTSFGRFSDKAPAKQEALRAAYQAVMTGDTSNITKEMIEAMFDGIQLNAGEVDKLKASLVDTSGLGYLVKVTTIGLTSSFQEGIQRFLFDKSSGKVTTDLSKFTAFLNFVIPSQDADGKITFTIPQEVIMASALSTYKAIQMMNNHMYESKLDLQEIIAPSYSDEQVLITELGNTELDLEGIAKRTGSDVSNAYDAKYLDTIQVSRTGLMKVLGQEFLSHLGYNEIQDDGLREILRTAIGINLYSAMDSTNQLTEYRITKSDSDNNISSEGVFVALSATDSNSIFSNDVWFSGNNPKNLNLAVGNLNAIKNTNISIPSLRNWTYGNNKHRTPYEVTSVSKMVEIAKERRNAPVDAIFPNTVNRARISENTLEQARILNSSAFMLNPIFLDMLDENTQLSLSNPNVKAQLELLGYVDLDNTQNLSKAEIQAIKSRNLQLQTLLEVYNDIIAQAKQQDQNIDIKDIRIFYSHKLTRNNRFYPQGRATIADGVFRHLIIPVPNKDMSLPETQKNNAEYARGVAAEILNIENITESSLTGEESKSAADNIREYFNSKGADEQLLLDADLKQKYIDMFKALKDAIYENKSMPEKELHVFNAVFNKGKKKAAVLRLLKSANEPNYAVSYEVDGKSNGSANTAMQAAKPYFTLSSFSRFGIGLPTDSDIKPLEDIYRSVETELTKLFNKAFEDKNDFHKVRSILSTVLAFQFAEATAEDLVNPDSLISKLMNLDNQITTAINENKLTFSGDGNFVDKDLAMAFDAVAKTNKSVISRDFAKTVAMPVTYNGGANGIMTGVLKDLTQGISDTLTDYIKNRGDDTTDLTNPVAKAALSGAVQLISGLLETIPANTKLGIYAPKFRALVDALQAIDLNKTSIETAALNNFITAVRSSSELFRFGLKDSIGNDLVNATLPTYANLNGESSRALVGVTSTSIQAQKILQERFEQRLVELNSHNPAIKRLSLSRKEIEQIIKDSGVFPILNNASFDPALTRDAVWNNGINALDYNIADGDTVIGEIAASLTNIQFDTTAVSKAVFGGNNIHSSLYKNKTGLDPDIAFVAKELSVKVMEKYIQVATKGVAQLTTAVQATEAATARYALTQIGNIQGTGYLFDAMNNTDVDTTIAAALKLNEGFLKVHGKYSVFKEFVYANLRSQKDIDIPSTLANVAGLNSISFPDTAFKYKTPMGSAVNSFIAQLIGNSNLAPTIEHPYTVEMNLDEISALANLIERLQAALYYKAPDQYTRKNRYITELQNANLRLSSIAQKIIHSDDKALVTVPVKTIATAIKEISPDTTLATMQDLLQSDLFEENGALSHKAYMSNQMSYVANTVAMQTVIANVMPLVVEQFRGEGIATGTYTNNTTIQGTYNGTAYTVNSDQIKEAVSNAITAIMAETQLQNPDWSKQEVYNSITLAQIMGRVQVDGIPIMNELYASVFAAEKNEMESAFRFKFDSRANIRHLLGMSLSHIEAPVIDGLSFAEGLEKLKEFFAEKQSSMVPLVEALIHTLGNNNNGQFKVVDAIKDTNGVEIPNAKGMFLDGNIYLRNDSSITTALHEIVHSLADAVVDKGLDDFMSKDATRRKSVHANGFRLLKNIALRQARQLGVNNETNTLLAQIKDDINNGNIPVTAAIQRAFGSVNEMTGHQFAAAASLLYAFDTLNKPDTVNAKELLGIAMKEWLAVALSNAEMAQELLSMSSMTLDIANEDLKRLTKGDKKYGKRNFLDHMRKILHGFRQTATESFKAYGQILFGDKSEAVAKVVQNATSDSIPTNFAQNRDSRFYEDNALVTVFSIISHNKQKLDKISNNQNKSPSFSMSNANAAGSVLAKQSVSKLEKELGKSMFELKDKLYQHLEFASAVSTQFYNAPKNIFQRGMENFLEKLALNSIRKHGRLTGWATFLRWIYGDTDKNVWASSEFGKTLSKLEQASFKTTEAIAVSIAEGFDKALAPLELVAEQTRALGPEGSGLSNKDYVRTLTFVNKYRENLQHNIHYGYLAMKSYWLRSEHSNDTVKNKDLTAVKYAKEALEGNYTNINEHIENSLATLRTELQKLNAHIPAEHLEAFMKYYAMQAEGLAQLIAKGSVLASNELISHGVFDNTKAIALAVPLREHLGITKLTTKDARFDVISGIEHIIQDLTSAYMYRYASDSSLQALYDLGIITIKAGDKSVLYEIPTQIDGEDVGINHLRNSAKDSRMFIENRNNVARDRVSFRDIAIGSDMTDYSRMDSSISYKTLSIKSTDAIEEAKRQGYTIVYSIKDASGKAQWLIMEAQSNVSTPILPGFIDATEKTANGADVYTGLPINFQGKAFTDQESINLTKQMITGQLKEMLSKGIGEFYTGKTSESSFGITSAIHGDISSSRITIPQHILNKNNSLRTNIGGYAIGSAITRSIHESESTVINEKSIQVLQDRYAKASPKDKQGLWKVINKDLINRLNSLDYDSLKRVNRKEYLKVARELHQIKAIWEILPNYLRDAVDSGRTSIPIYIPEMHTILGYKQLSLPEVIFGREDIPKELKAPLQRFASAIFGNKAYAFSRGLFHFQETLKDTATFAKKWLLLYTGQIAIGNIISNYLHLYNAGLPLNQLLNKNFMVNAYKEYKEFQELQDDLNSTMVHWQALEYQSYADPSGNKVYSHPKHAKALQLKIKQLKDKLDADKFRYTRLAYQSGLITTASSEVNRTIKVSNYVDRGDISELDRIRNFNVFRRGENSIKNVWENIKQSPETAEQLETLELQLDLIKDMGSKNPIYKNITSHQLSLYMRTMEESIDSGDHLAKVLLIKHLVENKGLSEKDAINVAREEFVDYSKNRGIVFDFANSLGLTWFAPFAFGIQKIIWRTLTRSPLKTAAIYTGSDWLNHIPLFGEALSAAADSTILHSNVFEKSWLYMISPVNRFQNPADYWLFTLPAKMWDLAT